MSDDWCTIESDPGVFTSLCEEIGVKGVQFEEIYSLGPEAFAALEVEKIYGLVFLFKWDKETDDRPAVDAADHGIFFAQQVIHNACATQAILSVLMNATAENVDLGPHLKEFREFTANLAPEMKGLAISNSEPIRKAHNSFHKQSSFEIIQDKDSKGEDAFHFVGYICHEGKVYELDGLKKGPILIGDVPAGTPWAERAREEVQRRIEAYSKKAGADGSAELRFNLMAIVANRLQDAEKRIERERFLRQRANISLVSRNEDVELLDEVEDDDAPADIPSFEDLSAQDVPAVRAIVARCTSTIDEMGAVMESEKKRRAQWAAENALRRADLVPLALCAMRHLARKKRLMPAFEKGKAAHAKRVEEAKAAGKH
uniref:Ubiquitin carboxyl-terminal hydrolase n=1 Tax=Alexandrium andersonii TaxID=327968 RepID=A0A7S2ABW8_9DINO|mmetsp:Transcript_10025/g.22831  ORF Transcript_10025/g.22831 Transcript_10025/m.22831 type:complete len:371 (+) Transcript_10025:90-1202(+)